MKVGLYLSTYFLCLFASFLSGLLGVGEEGGLVVFVVLYRKKGPGTLSHLAESPYLCTNAQSRITLLFPSLNGDIYS